MGKKSLFKIISTYIIYSVALMPQESKDLEYRWLFFSLNFDNITWKPAIDSNRFSKFDHWLLALARLLSKRKLLTIYKRESSQKPLSKVVWMFFTQLPVICDHYRCTNVHVLLCCWSTTKHNLNLTTIKTNAFVSSQESLNMLHLLQR